VPGACRANHWSCTAGLYGDPYILQKTNTQLLIDINVEWTYLDELEKYFPEIVHAATVAYDKLLVDLGFLRFDKKAFLACSSESIDYAVMENTDISVVVSMDTDWIDIGYWSALSDVAAKDSEDDNVFLGDFLTKNVINSDDVV
jgi:mannose-1-phosphate guanylyltransferase